MGLPGDAHQVGRLSTFAHSKEPETRMSRVPTKNLRVRYPLAMVGWRWRVGGLMLVDGGFRPSCV